MVSCALVVKARPTDCAPWERAEAERASEKYARLPGFLWKLGRQNKHTNGIRKGGAGLHLD